MIIVTLRFIFLNLFPCSQNKPEKSFLSRVFYWLNLVFTFKRFLWKSSIPSPFPPPLSQRFQPSISSLSTLSSSSANSFPHRDPTPSLCLSTLEHKHPRAENLSFYIFVKYRVHVEMNSIYNKYSTVRIPYVFKRYLRYYLFVLIIPTLWTWDV